TRSSVDPIVDQLQPTLKRRSIATYVRADGNGVDVATVTAYVGQSTGDRAFIRLETGVDRIDGKDGGEDRRAWPSVDEIPDCDFASPNPS
ncbi:hypothetical protein ABTP64_18655, partial [Acinetobacter baumannii]